MKSPFRRHRGSQSEAPTPNYRMHITAPDADPAQIARVFAAALMGKRLPEPLTARQVLTVVLMQVPSIAEEFDYAQTVVDDILLALQANGLEIVQSGEVE